MWDDFTMPIVHILTTGGLGNPAEAEAFNYFFSLVLAMGFLMFMTIAIIKLINRS